MAAPFFCRVWVCNILTRPTQSECLDSGLFSGKLSLIHPGLETSFASSGSLIFQFYKGKILIFSRHSSTLLILLYIGTSPVSVYEPSFPLTLSTAMPGGWPAIVVSSFFAPRERERGQLFPMSDKTVIRDNLVFFLLLSLVTAWWPRHYLIGVILNNHFLSSCHTFFKQNMCAVCIQHCL